RSHARLSRLPFFLQKMIKGRVEIFVRGKGRNLVTLEDMEELRQNTFGNTKPVFDAGQFKGLE
ncbi:MAG: PCP reductase family protein, partial [Nitrospirae bacterium]|nr:PCP reductase family protein [Nitrospirota bacterium]